MAPIAWDGSNFARHAFWRIEHSSFKTPVQKHLFTGVRISDGPTRFAMHGSGVKFVVAPYFFRQLKWIAQALVKATMVHASGTRFARMSEIQWRDATNTGRRLLPTIARARVSLGLFS